MAEPKTTNEGKGHLAIRRTVRPAQRCQRDTQRARLSTFGSFTDRSADRVRVGKGQRWVVGAMIEDLAL